MFLSNVDICHTQQMYTQFALQQYTSLNCIPTLTALVSYLGRPLLDSIGVEFMCKLVTQTQLYRHAMTTLMHTYTHWYTYKSMLSVCGLSHTVSALGSKPDLLYSITLLGMASCWLIRFQSKTSRVTSWHKSRLTLSKTEFVEERACTWLTTKYYW